jgi:glyoxylase-like metal-dependent hydrolase (beta-lactamase superfamily II)
MCLYEPDQKIFVAGDHILFDITPIISLRSDEHNPLMEYLAGLEKVDSLDIGLVLPGHRAIFGNCKKRIRELKSHHQSRSAEIISILKAGSLNAYEIASQMNWAVAYDSWDHFPVLQRWFAIGEAIAHLKYLEEKGILRKKWQKEALLYSLK